MGKLVEIRDRTSNGGTAVDLSELLSLFEEKGPGYYWTILELEVRGGDTDPVFGMSVLELERAAGETPTGYSVSWEELNALAECVEQIIDAVILACTDVTKIAELGPGTDVYAASEIVLELIDGTVWQVYVRDDSLLELFEDVFDDMEVVALDDPS